MVKLYIMHELIKYNLLNYESISGRNAQQVFTEMEWE